VVLRDKPAEMLTASPKGTVPVLVLPNGQVIDESIDIMRWALAQNDPENWLKDGDLSLVKINDDPFKFALDRYKYPHRYSLPDGLAHQSEGLKILLDWNSRLQRSAFLTGPVRNITDIALFPFVRQFAATDMEWFNAQPLQELHRWLSGITNAYPFPGAMQKWPQWRPLQNQ
jgi:glutathione S-transferase